MGTDQFLLGSIDTGIGEYEDDSPLTSSQPEQQTLEPYLIAMAGRPGGYVGNTENRFLLG